MFNSDIVTSEVTLIPHLLLKHLYLMPVVFCQGRDIDYNSNIQALEDKSNQLTANVQAATGNQFIYSVKGQLQTTSGGHYIETVVFRF